MERRNGDAIKNKWWYPKIKTKNEVLIFSDQQYESSDIVVAPPTGLQGHSLELSDSLINFYHFILNSLNETHTA
jgi:hypothetical protein